MTPLPPPQWLVGPLHVAVVGSFAYLGMLYLFVGTMLALAVVESRLRRKQNDAEDYGAVLGSRYTIPVSVIAPAFNEEVIAVAAVRSLLDLDYPELEVIVVDDGSTDGTLAALVHAFDLEPRQVFFRKALSSKPVRRVYRSRTEPRLVVVSKDNGGKADALNCGINFARYRYLCCVDGDTVFGRDALLPAMSLVVKDPGRIVAVSSLIGISVEPETYAGREGERRPLRTNDHLLADFQHLELMRSFVAYRLASSRLGCMMCVSGAFGVWRRDVILELGGFSPAFTCEDIEMTFRVHERLSREGRPYRILSLPSMVAQTEGPTSIRSLISQRARWQRVTLETVWHYRLMLGRRRYGYAAFVAIPYYIFFECLAPLFQVAAFAILAVAIVFGLLSWPVYLALLGILAFGAGIPTTVAIWLHDSGNRDYRMRDLIRMITMGPLDLIVYRPLLAYAGVRGCWEFLRRDKRWNKFERNVRSARAATAIILALLGARAAAAQSAEIADSAFRMALADLRAGKATRADSIAAAGLAAAPDDVDLMVLRGWALRRMNERPDALVLIDRASSLAPDRTDVRELRRRLHQELHGSEATLRAAYRNWDGGTGDTTEQALGPVRTTQAEWRKNTGPGIGIIRVASMSRLGVRDQELEVEAYPLFHSSYAVVGAALGANGSLYPRSSVMAELYRTYPRGGIEGSIGVRRTRASIPVSVANASIGFYHGSFLYGARVTSAIEGVSGRAFGLSTRRYFADGIQYVGLRVGAGSILDVIETQDDIAVHGTRGLRGEGYFLIRKRWIVSFLGESGLEQFPDAPTLRRTSVSLGFGMRFPPF